MVWGAIWINEHSSFVECVENVNSEKYIFILQQGLLALFAGGQLDKIRTLFMGDSAQCHSAKKTI